MRTKNLLILCLLIPSFSLTIAKSGEWKEYAFKEMVGRMKFYAFAKITQSAKEKYIFEKDLTIQYSNCPDEFPKLPGDFPCSLLTLDPIENKEYVADTTYGSGEIQVKLSQNKSMFGGKVLLLGLQEHEKDQSATLLKMFFKPNGHINHYLYQNKIVAFHWKKIEGSETLLSIFILEQDKNAKPAKAKEIIFNE